MEIKVEFENPVTRNDTLEIYIDEFKRWHWRRVKDIRVENGGEVVAESRPFGYGDRAECVTQALYINAGSYLIKMLE